MSNVDINNYRVVAIIPSLNPNEGLLDTIGGLKKAGFSDVIIVDDGSVAECQDIFATAKEIVGVKVLHHEVNKGKGRALKTAFSYYLNNYNLNLYNGVVTADADGQHLPKDIYETANVIAISGGGTGIQNVMALGTRDFDEEQVPFKSRNGNKITSRVFKVLYGKWLNDTQTGLRAIPNEFLQECLELRGERFEYEINMLIAAVNKKVKFIEVPIETVYFDDNRETHFHPVKDSIKIYYVMLETFLRFTCSGLVSMIIDQGIFAILQKLILASIESRLSIPISTAIARTLSSYSNYSMNKKFVFDSRRTNVKCMTRYYILCVAQMLVSAGGVTVFHLLTQWDTSLLKIIVDTMLFFVSYFIQRVWVFRE